jgi:hypothetical protein
MAQATRERASPRALRGARHERRASRAGAVLDRLLAAHRRGDRPSGAPLPGRSRGGRRWLRPGAGRACRVHVHRMGRDRALAPVHEAQPPRSRTCPELAAVAPDAARVPRRSPARRARARRVQATRRSPRRARLARDDRRPPASRRFVRRPARPDRVRRPRVARGSRAPPGGAARPPMAGAPPAPRRRLSRRRDGDRVGHRHDRRRALGARSRRRRRRPPRGRSPAARAPERRRWPRRGRRRPVQRPVDRVRRPRPRRGRAGPAADPDRGPHHAARLPARSLAPERLDRLCPRRRPHAGLGHRPGARGARRHERTVYVLRDRTRPAKEADGWQRGSSLRSSCRSTG